MTIGHHAELLGRWGGRRARLAQLRQPSDTTPSYTWPEMHRCVNLLQLQSELIESLTEQVTVLRAERDEARRIEADMSVMRRELQTIRHILKAQSERVA